MPPGTEAVDAEVEADEASSVVFPDMKLMTSCLVTLPSLPVPLMSLMLRLFYLANALTAGVDLAFETEPPSI
jgi:hypothetical protein